MKKALLTTILCISWELNAQVALPTFQGAQMPTPELEDTEWRFTADGVNNAGTSYYNSTSGSSSHSWTVPANVSHITILGISGGGGGSATTSTSGSGGISGGGGGGGGLGYLNNYSVSSGDVIAIYAGKSGKGSTVGSGSNAGDGGMTQVSHNGTVILKIYGGKGGKYLK